MIIPRMIQECFLSHFFIPKYLLPLVGHLMIISSFFCQSMAPVLTSHYGPDADSDSKKSAPIQNNMLRE